MKVKQLKRKMAALLAVAMVMTGQPSGVLAGGMPGDSEATRTAGTETVSTVNDANKNTKPNGSEITVATKNTANSGTVGGAGGTGTVPPKDEQDTFEVTYQVKPEEGAKVTGARTVKTGETLEFTVRVNEGYELDTVRVSGDVLEPVEETENKYTYEAANIMQAPEVEVTLTEEEKPAFSYEETIDGITVTLTAEEGVLPDGTKAEVKKVSVPKDAKETEEGEELIEAVAFDITLYDAEGNELDNSWAENGSVKVTFSGAELEEKQEEADRVEILHYAEEDAEPDVEAYAPGEELAYDAEHFSVFVAKRVRMITKTATSSYYVSADGSDENGDGTKDNPFATLWKAFDVADNDDYIGSEEEPTKIVVMSNLTMEENARSYGEHIWLTSDENGPYTVTRAEELFSMTPDGARSWYNPAMIEVNSSGGKNTASLKVTNIILDDAGHQMGNYYIQAASKGEGSTEFGAMNINHGDIVQDAIIATYDGVGTVTLGDGAVLKNYGGMSAVRISGGVLTMESGSKIIDDIVDDREKGSEIKKDNDLTISQNDFNNWYGPAGAVWVQGGTFIMEEGAIISDIVGRVAYVDNGNATINGLIQNCVADKDMWWGDGGYILHLRNENSSACLGNTGEIDGGRIETSGSAINIIGTNSFAMKDGSRIHDISNGNVIYVDGTARIDGEIDHYIGGSHVVQAGSSDFYIEIGKNANIHDNKVAYGTIYAYSNGPDENTKGNGKIDIYGKINNNISTDRGGAVAMANNGTQLLVTMYDGAEICNNVSYQTGGGILVSCGKFVMEGGTISGNISGAGNVGLDDAVGGGIYVRRGGSFIMNGGKVSDNWARGIGGNLAMDLDSYLGNDAAVQLNKGNISGGFMKATISGDDSSGYTGSAGQSNDVAFGHSVASDTNHYLSISDEIILGNPDIYFEKYDFSVENPTDINVKLGNADTECETAVTESFVGREPLYLSEVIGSFWYASGSEKQQFNISVPTAADPEKPIYAAVIPTREDGKPLAGVEPTLMSTETVDGRIDLVVPGSNQSGYAVVLVQETDASSIVSVIPADVTIYMGGDGGYDAVVGSGETGTTTSNSLPHPMFRILNSQGMTTEEIKALTFTNTDSNSSWKAVPIGKDGEEMLYRFEEIAESTPVRIQYSDANGNIITEDNFDPSEVEELYNEYSITVYAGNTSGNKVEARTTDEYFAVVTGAGSLTVRAVADSNSVSPVVKEEPSSKLTSGTAVAVAQADTIYTVNDTDVELPDDAKPALLFDNIIDDENLNRTELLQELINTEYGAEEGRQFEMKYLDLVDTQNGNAWITSSKGTDIYWGYPEGTDKETELKLIHFKNLHRDGTASGFDTEDIAQAELEEVQIEKLDTAIKFHVDKGGFSPFAVVWQNEAQPEPEPEPEDKTFTITATAGDHGSISPSGTVEVKEGDDLTFTITPDAGYKIDKIIVDGNVVETVNSYTFENVTGLHTIEVSFSRKSTGGGGSPSGSGSSGGGSGVAYTVGLNGNWVHMDPNDINTPISQMVPDGATPVSNPEWHQWKFILTDGSALTNRWAFIRNPYAVEGQPSEGWFSFDENGIMNYGWYLDQSTGKWYFLHRQSDGMLGTMIEGWHHDEQDGRWYYLQPGSGEMLLGWQEIGGRWYYFNPNAPQVTWNYNEATGGWTYNGSQSRPYGSMYQNEVTPDGYQVDGSGAWVQ